MWMLQPQSLTSTTHWKPNNRTTECWGSLFSLASTSKSLLTCQIWTLRDICGYSDIYGYLWSDLQTFEAIKNINNQLFRHIQTYSRLQRCIPPVSSVARVAPQSVSQRFEAPNALVDIPQHSLAHRRPGNMKMAWESRGHFGIGKSWSVGKVKCCWNIMNILWTSQNTTEFRNRIRFHRDNPPFASSHAWLQPWLHFHLTE